ncbi:MAG: hypothetical protein ACT4TC_10760 [Myxococcaceae bacterium]
MSGRRLAVLAFVGLTACGGLKKEELLTEEIKALCATLVRCQVAKSETDCVTAVTLGFPAQGLEKKDQAIAAGKLKYNESRAKKCVDALRNASCEVSALDDDNEDCQLAFEGLVAEGGACGDGQCVPGTYCSTEIDQTCPGTCKPLVAEAGAATSSTQCAAGLVVISNTCRKPIAAGAMCNASGCDRGLYCDNTTKVCTARAKKDEACGSASGCQPYLSCVSGKCTAAADEDQACGGQNAGPCLLDLRCAGGTLTTAGTCKKPDAEGAACTESSCAPGLSCYSGACRTRGATGVACAQNDDCANDFYCQTSSQTCQQEIASGQACTQIDSCATGACVQGKCEGGFEGELTCL